MPIDQQIITLEYNPVNNIPFGVTRTHSSANVCPQQILLRVSLSNWCAGIFHKASVKTANGLFRIALGFPYKSDYNLEETKFTLADIKS
jgi:hypothetical protein